MWRVQVQVSTEVLAYAWFKVITKALLNASSNALEDCGNCCGFLLQLNAEFVYRVSCGLNWPWSFCVFRALQEADVILLLAARLNWMLHFGKPPRFNQNVKIIQVIELSVVCSIIKMIVVSTLHGSLLGQVLFMHTCPKVRFICMTRELHKINVKNK